MTVKELIFNLMEYPNLWDRKVIVDMYDKKHNCFMGMNFDILDITQRNDKVKIGVIS